MTPATLKNCSPLWGAVFYCLLLFTAWLYWPGLSGSLLLDDHFSLKFLQKINDQPSLDTVIQYINDPTKEEATRHLSMLSFAAQFYSWNASPRPFKYVNLHLHLLNGCLLFWLLMRLTRFLPLSRQQMNLLALTTTGIWLIHPLNVSTTLYIVQRMTQLATLFSLLGLLAYLHGREQLTRKPHPRMLAGYLWMSGGVGVGGVLAILSKETGILLPLFILIMEATLLRSMARPGPWHRWSALFLLTPLLLLMIYFGLNWQLLFFDLYKNYDFTLLQRLMTECRVLSDYLHLLITPSLSALGLFHDDYPFSKTILDPPGTLAAMVFITTLLLTALYWRTTHPLFAFGVLWFLGGHTLESTILPLDLYFEHRNYFPAIGIWFMLVYGGMRLWERLQSSIMRTLLSTGAVLVCGMYAFLTHAETTLWGNPVQQTILWANQQPDSRRAQGQLAKFYLHSGQPDEAARLYQQLSQRLPKDMGALLYWLQLTCQDTRIAPPDQEQLLHRMRTATLYLTPIGEIVDSINNDDCPNLPIDTMLAILKVLPDNPTYVPHTQLSMKIALYGATLERKAGRLDRAMNHLETALQHLPSVNLALQKVTWLSEEQRFSEALDYLKQARQFNHGNPITQWMNEQRLTGWENMLRFLLQNTPSPSPAP